MSNEAVVKIIYVGFLGELTKKESETLPVPSDSCKALKKVREFLKSKYGIDKNYLISVTDNDPLTPEEIWQSGNSVVVKVVPILSGG